MDLLNCVGEAGVRSPHRGVKKIMFCGVCLLWRCGDGRSEVIGEDLVHPRLFASPPLRPPHWASSATRTAPRLGIMAALVPLGPDGHER